jgi:hypothetical protein
METGKPAAAKSLLFQLLKHQLGHLPFGNQLFPADVAYWSLLQPPFQLPAIGGGQGCEQAVHAN